MKESELGLLLVAAGHLTDQQLESAKKYKSSVGGSLSTIVVKLGFISENKMLNFLGEQEGLKVVDLDSMIIPVKLIATIPASLIEKYQILPVHQSGDVISIATADPMVYEAVQEIQFLTGKKIEINLASYNALKKAINRFLNLKEGVSDDLILSDLASDGKIKTYRDKKISKSKLYEIWQPALISLLIEKGVITEDELEAKFKEIKKDL
jgi:hypothetical protein